jgi:16S rRNA (uracil1498-N3)-methyltransferase
LSRPLGFAADVAATALVFVPSVEPAEHLLDGDDGHHLQRVRRVQPGERLVVADGEGAWAAATVVDAADGRLRVERDGPVTAEPVLVPRLAVAFAPAKGDHASDVVHALVELGVDRVVPIETRRSVVRWRGDRGRRAVERLRRVAREAATVAHRARIPAVEDPVALDELAGHPALVLADRAGVPARDLGAPAGGEWLVVTGPEGGLDPAETAALGPVLRLAIGAHVLRARTAPIAVAAALAGDRRASGADL